MTNSPDSSEKLDMNYAANAVLVFTILLIGYLALFGLSYHSIGADLYYTRISMIVLALSIIYVGLQIGRVAGKLR